MGFRRLDAFAKTRPDLQEKSAVGGAITAIAATCAGLLFVAQIVSYTTGTTQHSLHLARSQSTPLSLLTEDTRPGRNTKGRIPLFLHVTFPHLSCNQLDVSLDGASLLTGELEKIHGKHSIEMYAPTNSDAAASNNAFKRGKGCTVVGHLSPQIVSGVLTIGISRPAWIESSRKIAMLGLADESTMAAELSHFNVSHFIHNIQFGDAFPLATEKPLEKRGHWIKNNYGGIAVEHIQIKLIPTMYKKLFTETLAYQVSLSEHTIEPATLVTKGVAFLPGLVLNYDFTPLAVHHSNGRDSFLVFLSSLISIVGGVFVTVGLLTGCLVHSAQAVAKKID
jgi:hypothetical protein